jgi:hypothetical protein
MKGGVTLKRQSAIIAFAAAGVIAFLAAPARPERNNTAALTASDYFEIQQLSMRYTNALDSCADNGKEWASLFTPDGVFTYNTGKAEGRAALTTLAGSSFYCAPPKNALTVHHISVNVMIEPSPEGAIGKSDLLFVDIGPDGKTGQVAGGGKDFDVYVKTSEGWRFKSRQFLWPDPKNVARIPASELSHHPLSH